MKALTISDSESMVLALHDELKRSEDSRYDHRLHGVLMVAQGMSCLRVAELFGDAARTVEYWVHRFEKKGLAGLTEGRRSGRPQRLSSEQLARVGEVLRKSPREAGLENGLWDGKTLSAWIAKEFQVGLKARQCQRLFRQLNFRLRKPAPVIAPNRPEKQAEHAQRQAAHKKTPGTGGRSGN